MSELKPWEYHGNHPAHGPVIFTGVAECYEYNDDDQTLYMFRLVYEGNVYWKDGFLNSRDAMKNLWRLATTLAFVEPTIKEEGYRKV